MGSFIDESCERIREQVGKDHVILGLSGGVDSMVCTYLLKVIGHPFQAVHINYANRPECPQEVDLLRYWCNLLSIPLIVRTIDEINRPRCMEPEINLR
jgi:tRNA(Ile)-lysidine synthase TilS/MesJ